MKKIIMNVISVIMAVALVLVPLSTTPAKAANDAEVVARFTYSGQVYEYDTLSQAIADASTVGNLTVYLVSNYTLPADLEIPSNVTVTIPTSADYSFGLCYPYRPQGCYPGCQGHSSRCRQSAGKCSQNRFPYRQLWRYRP